MKKLLLGVCLLLSATLALAQMPEETWQEVKQAALQGNSAHVEQLLRPWAERGDARAQYNLGVMYYDGRGVAQDYTKALKWWEKAAAQGDADAQYSLGTMYDAGQGVAQDYAKARKWFEKAAAQGLAAAQYNLGFIASRWSRHCAGLRQGTKMVRESGCSGVCPGTIQPWLDVLPWSRCRQRLR